MILPWKVHVFDIEVEEFLRTIPRIWDTSTIDILYSYHKDRRLIRCYATEEEKTFLKIKFHIIEEDVYNKEE